MIYRLKNQLPDVAQSTQKSWHIFSKPFTYQRQIKPIYSSQIFEAAIENR